MKISTIIRLLLTAFICIMIYREAGIFTAIFACIMSIYVELNNNSIRKILNLIKRVNENT